MGVGADLYMYDVVVKTFTFAISSTGEFLYDFLHCCKQQEHFYTYIKHVHLT